MDDPTHETLAIGRKYTSGKECLPVTVTAGLLVQRILKDPNPERKFTFLMPIGRGPCRFGNYCHLHKIILERLGLDNRVNVWSPSDNDYFEGIPASIVALVYCSFVAADLLLAMRYDTRPAEILPGATDALYEKLADELDQLIEIRAAKGDTLINTAAEIATGRYYGIRDFLKKAVIAFTSIRKPGELPTVLVTGEIYMRCDPFSNDYVIDQLQSFGIRVKLAPFYEWLDYQEFINTQVGIPQTWNTWFTAKIQAVILASLYGTCATDLNWPRLARAKDYTECAEHLVRYQIEGEPSLTIGGPLHEWRHHEIDAALCVGPHECMPNKIAEAQFFHIAESEGLYSLTIPLNGDPVDPVIIENFVYEVRKHFEERSGRRAARPAPHPTRLGVSKDFLKDLVRGLPKIRS
jgi:predicted nucleotide-binding protein (sugar kinase/HSP70/actin superfamily)